MPKIFSALALGLVLFVTACTPGRVLMAPTQPIKGFNPLGVQVLSTSFLKTIEGTKNYDRYAAICKEGEEVIGSHIKNWAKTEWNGAPGGKPLWVRLELEEFNTGSGAAKLFLGSAANGRMIYKVTLLTQSETVAQYLFEAQVGLTGNTHAFWGIAKQVEKRLAKTE